MNSTKVFINKFRDLKEIVVTKSDQITELEHVIN